METDDDTIGISDQIVAFAQEAYVGAYGVERVHLKELLTRIGKNKPTLEELCTDTFMANIWYDILIGMLWKQYSIIEVTTHYDPHIYPHPNQNRQ